MARDTRTLAGFALALSFYLCAAQPAMSQASSAHDVAVAVHPDVQVDNLTIAELRRLALGDREFWPGSVRVTLIIRAPISHERDVVLKNICQVTEAQFRQHWIAKVFRADTALTPKIVYSTDMAVDMVNRIPGAIAFIDAQEVGNRAKIVKVDGRLPGENGYALR